MVHHIKYGRIVDAEENAHKLRFNATDEIMLSYLEMLLKIKSWKDVDHAKIVFKLKDGNELCSLPFNDRYLFEILTEYFLRKHFMDTALQSDFKKHIVAKEDWRDFIQKEIERLKSHKLYVRQN